MTIEEKALCYLLHHNTIDVREETKNALKIFGVSVENFPAEPIREKPLYHHDCKNCVYLGRWDDYDRTKDLYFCYHGPTVISRNSDVPHDYISGLSFAGTVSSIKEAVVRATMFGL